MKLLGYLAIATALFIGFVQFTSQGRDWWALQTARPEDDEKVAAYKLGRQLFLKDWPASPDAKLSEYDGNETTAEEIEGSEWLARGRATFMLLGTKVNHPWIAIFDRDERRLITWKVTETATAGQIRAARAKSGQWIRDRKEAPTDPPVSGLQRVAGGGARGEPKPTPAPKQGDWMWKGYRPALNPPPPTRR